MTKPQSEIRLFQNCWDSPGMHPPEWTSPPSGLGNFLSAFSLTEQNKMSMRILLFFLVILLSWKKSSKVQKPKVQKLGYRLEPAQTFRSKYSQTAWRILSVSFSIVCKHYSFSNVRKFLITAGCKGTKVRVKKTRPFDKLRVTEEKGSRIPRLGESDDRKGFEGSRVRVKEQKSGSQKCRSQKSKQELFQFITIAYSLACSEGVSL